MVSDSTGASPSADGTQYLSFNSGNQPAGTWIAQSINTSIGVAYEVTFYLASTGNGGGSVSLRASAKSQNGDTLAEITAIPPFHDTGYGPVQRLTFTATSATTTLEFLDTSSATEAIDLLLDNVVVH